jgi:hypothetical protein
MSLDIALMVKEPIRGTGTGIFVREDGQNRELTLKEAKERYPEADIKLQPTESNRVFDHNITHNLGRMADEAGVYYALWRPAEIGAKTAKDISPLLADGLNNLKANPDRFKKLNPQNGWGSYEGLVECVEQYLEACQAHPEAEIYASR